jgi:hypothetical protein
VKKSHYFAEMAFSYDAEISDLLTDSEGKRPWRPACGRSAELHAILPMIEFSPEMVVPVFYDAFSFTNQKAMAAAVQAEPDDDDFPTWERLAGLLAVKDWALPYVEAVLAEGAGEVFMVTAAGLEFIRKFDTAVPVAAEAPEGRGEGADDEDDDDGERDLAEAGDDWLAEQGFDSARS